MNKPLVSIIITTFAGSNVLSRSIQSVLNQTYKNWELIVVDDNNPDTVERQATEKVIKTYVCENIKYIKHTRNMNGSAARNTGIKNSSGEYIAFLDDDDIFYPTRLEKCIQTVINNTKCDSVLTNVIVTDGTSIIDCIEQNNHHDPLRDMFFGNVLGTGSNLFLSRKAVDTLGGFDESFSRRQDVEFMIRFYKQFKSAYLQENLAVKVVQHRKNITIDYPKFKSVEEHFIDTFREVVFDYLSDTDRMEYLNHTYTVLFRMAMVSSTEHIRLAVEDLIAIRPLSTKEKLMVRFEKLYRACRNNNFIYSIKRRKEQKNNAARVRALGVKFHDTDIQMLSKWGVIKEG